MNLNFKKNGGFITAVTVCIHTSEVLMVAHMNLEAFKATCSTGYATYFSKSRKKLWKKGETSGHLQRVVEMRVDCDIDAIVLLVEQIGDACHVGFRTCFFRSLDSDGNVTVVASSLLVSREMTEDSREKAFGTKIL